jgi:hypothetical protein
VLAIWISGSGVLGGVLREGRGAAEAESSAVELVEWYPEGLALKDRRPQAVETNPELPCLRAPWPGTGLLGAADAVV